jgi:hypothetical protein
MSEGEHEIDLVIVVSGVPRPVRVNVRELLRDVVRKVLAESGDAGRSPDEFELRTESGTLLDLNARVGQAGIVSGETLFLNPRAGAGG